MARKPSKKELVNTRLLKEYASWVYCEGCSNTVAYLCYVTYDLFELSYKCSCGSEGHVFIEFEHDEPQTSELSLTDIKNRLCCPADNSPLFTLVEKNIEAATYRVIFSACNHQYEN